MTCPICFEACARDSTSPSSINNTLIQTLVKFVDLSSPNLVWKTVTSPTQWVWCGEDRCHLLLNEFLTLVQGYRDLKQDLGRSLHKVLANLERDCVVDLESWARNRLEEECSWDGTKTDDSVFNVDVDEGQLQPNWASGSRKRELELTDDDQNDKIGNIIDDMDGSGARPKRNRKFKPDSPDSLQIAEKGGSSVRDSVRSKRNKTVIRSKRNGRKVAKSSKVVVAVADSEVGQDLATSTSKPSDNNDNICDKCGKVFLTSKSLRTHKRTHVREGMSDDGTFHCTHCPAILSSLQELKKHRTVEHEKPRDFCPLCRRQLSKGALVQHLHSHMKKTLIPLSAQEEEIINCLICQRPFNSPPLLATHMTVHKGDYSCNVPTCRKSFYSAAARNKHAETIHEQNQLDCIYCFQVFKSDAGQEFQLHLKNHEDEVISKRFLCETCGCGSYFTKKSLQQHVRQNHPSQAGPTCEVCGKSFVNPQRLKVHLLTHKNKSQEQADSSSNPTLFTCPESECGKIFGQKVSLQSHLMVHHANEMRYKCPHCDISGFTYSQGLRSHVFKHHNEVFRNKNYLCGVCYKNFLTEEELLLHEGNHNKLKCQLCSKQFKSMNHLKEHTLRHAAVRPFKCPHCPSKGYVRKQQLNDHLRKVHQQDSTRTTHSTENSGQLTERITYVIQIP